MAEETQNLEQGTGLPSYKDVLGIKDDGGIDETPEEKPVEEQQGGQPAETPKEEIVPPAEGQEEATNEIPTEPQEPAEGDGGEEPVTTSFEINDFNERFSTEFADEESLKAALSDVQRIAELEEQVKEIERYKEENLLLREQADPMKHFSSEEEYKIAKFKQQFPDKNAPVAYQLLGSDLSQMKDQDVLAYEIMLEDPQMSKADADELVTAKFNIEDGEEMDRLTKNQLRLDANAARKRVNALKKEIQVPDKFDADSYLAQQKELQEQKKAQRKEGWQKIVPELANSLKDFVFTDEKDGEAKELFRYSIGKDAPTDIAETVIDNLVATGVEVTRENAAAVQEALRKEWAYRNLDRMVKAAYDDAMAKSEEKRLEKQHNPGSAKPSAKPPETGKKDYDSDILSRTGWYRPQPFSNK